MPEASISESKLATTCLKDEATASIRYFPPSLGAQRVDAKLLAGILPTFSNSAVGNVTCHNELGRD